MSSNLTPTNITVILVDKNGTVKELTIKNFQEGELYKKCGFKKNDGFEMQCEWKKILFPSYDSKKENDVKKILYSVVVYGKKNKSTVVNKYDFPPPIDNVLFSGNCVILLKKYIYNRETKKQEGCLWENLTLQHWEKIYEKLFGGFELLSHTKDKDENEPDELSTIDKSKLTKDGYVKDEFVVSDNEDNNDNDDNSSESDSVVSDDDNEDSCVSLSNSDNEYDSESDVDVKETNTTDNCITLEEDNDNDNDNEKDMDKNEEEDEEEKNAKGKKKQKIVKTRVKKMAHSKLFDLSMFEKDELEYETYLSSDDES